MSGADLVAVADKRLALAEAGGIEESHQHMPVLPRGPSIGNPAPLGLLCFGMTTGKASSPRCACVRTGGGVQTLQARWLTQVAVAAR
jgi:hypothetical protein